MQKVILSILMLCSYATVISQNLTLLKNVYPDGIAGNTQIVKTNNYHLFDREDAADTDRSLFRNEGNNVTKANSFTPTTLDNWGIVGSATPNGWGGGPDMPLTYNAASNTWSAAVSLASGEIKFRANNDWAVNYGDNGADGTLEINGSNIIVAAGNYLITLDFTTLNYSIISTKAYYVNDNLLAGDLFTSATGDNANAGTKAAPFATITYALSQAGEGDTICVDAGSYTEQVTIDKGITIIGAGQNLTSILVPAVTIAPTPVPPSTFNEKAVIQTAQSITGDVHISNLSVSGDYTVGVTPIIIQSGGSVKNCKLQNGNQGIFVRVDPAITLTNKQFVVDGNTINAEYIAINFAGTRLTATLTNNVLAVFNPGFSTGVFAGTDFGTLAGLTVTGNTFSSFVSDGLFVNTNNGIISQNSFLGTGAKAINKFGGNTINATCNWYGSADVNVVAFKITPGVNFSPWLVNGTDNSSSIGFQPVVGACTGKQTRYYVNNNTSGIRVFTTAAGDDANPGIPSSPLASISAAYQKAQTGDSLFLDAGTYSPGDGTIGKSISIIGTNYLLSPNDAANPLLINSTRNAETIIDNLTWTIGASEVTLEGLTFNSTSKQIIALNNTSFNNIKLARNRVTINSNLTLFNFTGSGVSTIAPSAIVNSGLTITDSRFEKFDATNGLVFNINKFRNVAITNNSFVIPGATKRIQSAVNIGSSGVVDGLYIANNTIDYFITAFAGSRFGTAFIYGNRINNTNNGFVASNSIPESSSIIFNNNILDGNDGTFPFIQYNRSGGNAVGATSSFTAEENIITGSGVAGTTTLLGSMNLIFFNTVLSPSVTVRNNKITFGGDLSTVPAHFIRPIMLRGNLASALIEKNEINLTGINQQQRTAGVDLPVSPAITLHPDNGSTSFLQTGSVINILNNKINGFKNSFAVYDAVNGRDTYIGYGNIYSGVTVNVNNNSFTGDSISINNGSIAAATVINASCNWYGSALEADVKQKISIADVQHIPWLTDGTDNDVATGFQPVANSCNGYQNKLYVNDVWTATDVFTTANGSNTNPGTAAAPFATIGYAISLAKAGDTIFVDAGSYTPLNFTITKGITILGANYLISPNSIADPLVYNTSRNTESVISSSQITFSADNIRIEGLTFNTPSTNQFILDATAVANGLCNNIKIARNRFVSSTSALNVMVFTGKAVTPATTDNVLIHDNRMENATGAYMRIDNFNNFTITKNSFIRTTAQPSTLAIRHNAGRFENLVVDENVFQNWDATLFTGGGVVKNLVYNNNKAYNTFRGLQFNGAATEQSTITVTNSLFQQHTSAGATASMFIGRTAALNAAAPNIIKVQGNTFSYDGTGQASIPPTLADISCNNSGAGDPLSSNFQVTFRQNIISYSGNLSTASNLLFPFGVRISGTMAVTNIDSNEINYTATNLANPPANIILRPSGIIIGASGNIPSGASLNIHSNKVIGFKQSLIFFTGSAYGGLVSGVNVNVNNNSFTGDSVSINNGTVSTKISTTCNWYGSTDEAVINSKLSLSTIQPIPWLTNGTDNNVAIGFQPVPNSCNGYSRTLYVNNDDPGLTGDVFTTAVGNNGNPGTAAAPFATLDFAYSVAKPGDTIYVDAGSYTLSSALTISKSITILGTNYLVSPNDAATKTIYNSSRHAESRITGAALVIGADNINIKGLRFSPTATAISQNGNYSHIKIEKTYFDVVGTGNTVTLQGSSGSPIVAFDFSITDSRFERTDISAGSSINLGWVRSLWIDDNVFIESPAGNPYRGFAVRTVGGQSVGSTVFSNNYVKKLQVGLIPQIIQDWTITNNVFDSCTTAYNHTPANAVSNNIFIRSNTFTNLRVGRSILVRGGTNGGVNNLNIIDNTHNQEVDGINGIVGMIQLDFGATNNNGTVSVLRNKLNLGGNYDNTGIPANCGIILIGKHSNTTIAENELTFTAINARVNAPGVLPPVPTGIFISTDGGSGSGPIPAGSIININNNKFNGFKSSIGIFDPVSTGLTPAVGYGYLTNGATVNINNNSFTGDSMSIDNGVVSQPVNASCNWYGSATAQDIVSKISLATVDIVPWLTNGTDNNVATGFQPVPGSCDGYPTLITLDNSTNVTCNGSATGSINITTTYGKAPFNYTWTKEGDANFVSHDEDPTGLTAGTYHLAILDGNGSNIYITDPEADGPGTITVTITEPDVLSATATGDNNICFNGIVGAASVIAEGGTAPYTYLWNTGATTNEITNLAAGVYSVTVTDANGCTTTASYEVTQPAQVTASVANTSTACSNIATVTAGGGTPGYTYLWSNGSTAATINGVPVGPYSVTVTDANGCSATASVTLTVAEAFNPSASVTNVTCFGANNGIITVTNANGTGQLMFSKDGGVSFVNGVLPFSFTNLAPGTYNIAVKDASGCTGFVERTVSQPTQLTATLGTVQSTCFGLSTGSISVTVAGGEAAYSYSWTKEGGGFSSSQLNISNLAAGVYTLTVTDKNNCTVVVPVTVNPFPAIVIPKTITDVSCKGGSNGSINITAMGGSGSGFTYSWTGAVISSNEDLSNITKGTYKIRVTDIGSGCFVDSTFIVTEPGSNLSLTTSRTNATGCSSLGTATGAGSGGTAPYTYNINGGVYQSSGLFTDLYAGSYTIGIMDARGCTTTKVVAITDNGADEYEGTGSNKNNTRTKAFAIPIESVIYARIPTVADSVDWYKFTTAGAGDYTVTFSHPNPAIVFHVYSASGTNPLPTLTGSTATSKKYNLSGGTLYNVRVNGGLSFTCYSLKVSSGIVARLNNNQTQVTENNPVLTTDVLSANVYPNPHNGNFTLSIDSPEEGVATVEMFTVNGQKLSERKANVVMGKGNTVKYSNMNYAILFYKVRIGKHTVTGKIISPN